MTYDRRPPQECPPASDHPAPQPTPPSNGSTCQPIPPTTPPTLTEPEPCPPDPSCKCPTKPGSSSNCLEDLITRHQADIANGEKATKFKGDLDDLLKLARAASQKYTRSKYDELVKIWIEQDISIAQLIARLVCIIPCWRCVIDCYICPILDQLRRAEELLYDKDKLITSVNDLYDLQYWHTRDKQIKDRRIGRIEKVLTAWTKVSPAETIENTLKANKDLAAAISGTMGNDPAKAIYDVFFKLIPRHLAIAPPKSVATTRIDENYYYTEFCKCDEGEKDDCCGPDVGKLRLRERLVGPLPYLIDPNEYFTLICCIVDKRFRPAKEAAWKAETDLNAVTARIAALVAQLGPDWPAKFEIDAKGAIPSVIDCCDYDPRETGSRSSSSR
jgi:hypothetical protein